VSNIFKKLFKVKEEKVEEQPEVTNIKTAPLSEEQIGAVSSPPIAFEPLQFLVGLGQSVGKQREHNEDSLFMLNALVAGEGGSVDGVPFGIFIIADGMGGHQHGEVASGVAVKTFANYLLRKLYLPFFSPNSEPQSEPVQEIIKKAIVEVQQAVLSQAPGGGTTLTSAFVMGGQVTLANVGDSRTYFIFPDGRIQAMTRDHSLVRRLIELGQITEKEALVHPQRNVLYRAIGQAEPFEPDISTFPMPHPGYLMLCTDGLWGVVPEIEIFNIVTKSSDPTAACHRLIEVANQNGGPDNISVILIYYPGK